MLEKPAIPDENILAAVQAEFGLRAAQLTFLPLGADQNTAVYRLETGQAAYFLKLRRGVFDELSLEIPRFLKTQGLRTIIAPLETQAGQFSAWLGEYRLILYPFVVGQDGYETALTERQWRELGFTLREIHTTQLPPELSQRLARETFSPVWRDKVKYFQTLAASATFRDSTALKLATFMREQRAEITQLVQRTEDLGRLFQVQPPKMVLCHADVHPGNLLIPGPDEFYLVDWDQPVLAPKERDLVLIGGGATWNRPAETAWFYQSYGTGNLDPAALAYFRYERIIQDLAVECELIFLGEAGGADREQEYRYFVSNFLPGHELELARRADTGF